jgi:hypothetical protein
LKAAETTTALLIAIVRKQDFPSNESIVLMPNRIASAGKSMEGRENGGGVDLLHDTDWKTELMRSTYCSFV